MQIIAARKRHSRSHGAILYTLSSGFLSIMLFRKWPFLVPFRDKGVGPRTINGLANWANRQEGKSKTLEALVKMDRRHSW